MNNYDQSSSGVNLDLNISYDLDRGRREFEESFHILKHQSYREHSVIVFNQYGNFDVSNFSLTDLVNYDLDGVTVKQVFEMYYNHHYPTTLQNDLKAGDYQGIKELIWTLDVTGLKDLEVSELLELIETDLYSDDDFAEFLSNNFNVNYEKVVSRGYCQGDYAEIIIPKIVLDSYITGCNGIETHDQVVELLQDTIDHLLWDQPLYARLEIDDNEFYIDEHLKDSYNYDQDEIIKILEKHLQHEKKAYIIDWVNDNLPTDPACY